MEDQQQAWPLQTMTIHCEKANKTCIEASAVLPELDQLFPVTIHYLAITRWDNDLIIFEGPGAACTAETYQVNLQTQMVTGLRGRKSDAAAELCGQTDKTPKRMRMIDGYEYSRKKLGF